MGSTRDQLGGRQWSRALEQLSALGSHGHDGPHALGEPTVDRSDRNATSLCISPGAKHLVARKTLDMHDLELRVGVAKGAGKKDDRHVLRDRLEMAHAQHFDLAPGRLERMRSDG